MPEPLRRPCRVSHDETRSSLALVLGVAIAFALAACTHSAPPAGDPDPDPAPDPVADPNRIEGTLLQGSLPNLGVGIVLVDDTPGPAPFAASERTNARTDVASEARSSALVSGDGVVYLGAFAPVADDGTFAIELPSIADLPETALRPGNAFVPMVERILDCGLVSDDPAARATSLRFTFDSVVDDLPMSVSVVALSIVHLLTVALDEAPAGDDPLASIERLVTWVYADRGFRAVSSGDCVVDGVFALDVDLDLEAGWNQVLWGLAGGSVTVRRRDPAPVFVVPFEFLGGAP